MTIPLSPIVAIALLGYFIFAIWSAYSTGYNKGLLKKHGAKGIIQYGPYLSLAISFFGVMLVIFLSYELLSYYSGFLKLSVPTGLANLDFLTFVIHQFDSLKLIYIKYVAFLLGGVLISAAASYVIVHFLYMKGFNSSSR